MPVKLIERIRMPDRHTFFSKYVATRQPVIITDLFEGQPIREIRTFEDAKRAFGNVQLRVRTEYVAAAASSNPTVETMSFDSYWRLVDSQPQANVMCTEYEVPARILTLVDLPPACRSNNVHEDEILSLPRKYGDHDLMSNLFVANRGNVSHLHYDGDHRQVFLYQVFGVKDVILFQPSSGIKLKPLDCRVGFSGIFLERMSRQEKMEFIDQADGYFGTLTPGDTIYMPMLIWHHLEYVEHAMSFNIRFGRNRAGRFACVDNFHRDYYIQNFCALLGGEIPADAACQESFSLVVEEYLRPAATRREKLKSVRDLFRGLCRDICPEARTDDYCPAERENEEVDKILKEIESTMQYADPDAIARSRPSGPISSVQKRQLEENAARCGYSPDVFHKLLYNKVAKSEIADLTKAEAAQLIAYMKSAGAIW
jgi:hypothetical protein